MDRKREKLLNAIIFLAENTKFCHKLKLMKLLYYLDFWHFKETGKPVTGLSYKTWKNGPVPPGVYYEVEPEKNPDDLRQHIFIEKEEFENKEGHCLHFKPIKKFNEKLFTKRELEILERVAFTFREAKGKDMSDSTHLKNSPWYQTMKQKGESKWIDYFMALDEEANSLSKTEVEERLQLDKETKELLEINESRDGLIF